MFDQEIIFIIVTKIPPNEDDISHDLFFSLRCADTSTG
jgi:hypothetical protein